jgi:LysM repeat protein
MLMRQSALARCLAIVALAALLAACGGSNNSNNTNRNITQLHDPKAAPTASAPAALSTPLVAGNLPAAGAAAAAGGGVAGDTYVVASGDTLGAIADKNGISVAELEAFNPGVDPARLQIGQTLHIPKPGQTPAPSSTPAANSAGGAALSTPGPQPTAANGPVNIPPTGGAPNGNSTAIPSANASATTAAGSATAVASAGEYIVKSGDNACRIATDAKITVQELAAANNLTTAALTRLTVGQVLKIPPSTGHIGCT